MSRDMVDTDGEVSGWSSQRSWCRRCWSRGAAVARAHGISKTWLYELLARYRTGGEAGLVARSRRPHRSPSRVPEAVEDEIVQLRKQLVGFGTDAGPDTIHTHLARNHDGVAPCSVSSIWRTLTRRGFITPEPHKRPKSSSVRFEANLPNECWQMDVTHVALRNGRVVDVPQRHRRPQPPLRRQPRAGGHDRR